jgi:hypothetical protein
LHEQGVGGYTVVGRHEWEAVSVASHRYAFNDRRVGFDHEDLPGSFTTIAARLQRYWEAVEGFLDTFVFFAVIACAIMDAKWLQYAIAWKAKNSVIAARNVDTDEQYEGQGAI